MGKHHDKIAASLERRRATASKDSGNKMPGSMNKKKTGYRSIKADAARKIINK